MKLPSVRLLVIASCLGLMSVVAACGSKSKPAAPLAPTTPTVVTPKFTAGPSAQSPTDDTSVATPIKLTLKNAAVQGTVTNVKYRFEWSEKTDFPENSGAGNFTGNTTEDGGDNITQDGGGETSYTIKRTLRPGFKYYWRGKAIADGVSDSDWSSTATFTTDNKGFFNGQNVYDPLTEGKTVASRVVGGRFVTGANGGWQALGMGDGLDYDIPSCASCKVEFDATNFGNGEGVSALVDVKWFSMGDAATMNDFIAFRNSPWKMHLEQRSDGDGSGMQLIWRNGATDDDSGGDPEYGDHRGKFLFGGPDWGHSFDNKVWHFIVEWTRGSYKISIAENGGTPRQWFPGPGGDTGLFGGNHPYNPPNHRIELGCVARNESMVGVIYRNFKVTPQ